MQETLNAVATWLPIVAFFLPLVVGLVSKSSLSRGGKTVVMLILTGVAALISQVDMNAGVLSVEMLTTWIGTMIVTVASYYGVWNPIGAGNIAPEKGIGPADSEFPLT
jgi:hypothetical protein